MPRRGHVPKRDVLPDPIYNDKIVSKLINAIMLTVRKALLKPFAMMPSDIIKENRQGSSGSIPRGYEQHNATSEVKARRVGGATYQVPMEVRPERRLALGLRWLVGYARKRGERTMKERLAGEILDATNNMGGAVKKKDDTTKWQKPIRHSLITGGKFNRSKHRTTTSEGGYRCPENSAWRIHETSVLWHTSTQVKPPQLKEFCIIPPYT